MAFYTKETFHIYLNSQAGIEGRPNDRQRDGRKEKNT